METYCNSESDESPDASVEDEEEEEEPQERQPLSNRCCVVKKVPAQHIGCLTGLKELG